MDLSKILEMFDKATKEMKYHSNEDVMERVKQVLFDIINITYSDDAGFVAITSKRLITLIDMIRFSKEFEELVKDNPDIHELFILIRLAIEAIAQTQLYRIGYEKATEYTVERAVEHIMEK